MSLPEPSVKAEPSGEEVLLQPKRPALHPWHYVMALCPPPLALALVIFMLAWALGMARGPLTIDIGADNQFDALYFNASEDGLFAPESRPPSKDFPEADNTYRWATRNIRLKIPWPLDAVPLKAMLRASAPRPSLPADQTGVTVKARGKVEWSEQDLGTIGINGPYDGNYYQFKLPSQLRPSLAPYEIWLETDNAYRPAAGDARSLSVVLFSLRLEPDYARFGWQGWLATAARPGLLAFLAFCCWGIGRLLLPVARRQWALGLEVVAGGLLLLSMLGWPQAAEPLYASWAFILPLGWLLLLLAELFRRRVVSLPAPFIYTATLFPILPLAQFGFGRLNLYSVNPSSVLIGVYVGALFYIGAIYISSGPTNPAAFEQAFVRGVLIASLVSFGYDHFHVFETNLYRGADFKVYYGALLSYEQGGSLYNLRDLIEIPGYAARQPPGFVLTLWPLVRLFGADVGNALLAWRIVNELLLIPCLLVLLRVFGGERDGKRLSPAVWFLALNFGQIAESVGYGQWNIFGLLGLSLMALWVKERRPGLSGVALALPVSLKLYPVVSALYFVLEKRAWRGLGGLAVGGAVIAGLAGLAVSFNQLWFYVTQVVFGINRPEISISNQSLWGFWGRLALPRVSDEFKGELPDGVALLSYACVLLFTAVTCWVLWRRHGGDDASQQLKMAALALLAVLIPPFVWFHYIVPCLVGVLALMVVLSRRESQLPKWQLVLFALAYAALAYGGRNDFFFSEAVGLARLGSSYRFLAAFVLWGLSLWLLWQRQPGEK